MNKSVDEILERIAKLKAIDFKKMYERNNTNPTVVRARHLAAHILSRHWNDPDEELVQQRLDCSIAFIRIANKLAQTDEKFQADVRTITGEEAPMKTSAPPIVDAPKVAVTTTSEIKDVQVAPETFLFRVGLEQYGFSREEILEKKTNYRIAHARAVMILLAKEVFSMKSGEIAKMLGYDIHSVSRILGEAITDFNCPGSFRREVQDVANRFGVSLDKGRKVPA